MPPTEARRLRWAAVVLILIGGDVITGYLGLAAAYGFRYGTDVLPAVAPTSSYYPPVMLLVLLACLAGQGLYRDRYATVGGLDEYRRVALATVVASITVVLGGFLINENTLSRGFLVASLLFTTFFVSLNRFFVRRLVQRWRDRGVALRRLLIVGANAQGVELARGVLRTSAASSTVCGFLDEYRPVGAEVQGFPVLGDPLSVEAIAARVGATHVIVIQSALSWEATHHVVEYLHRAPHVEVLLAPGVHAVNAAPLELVQIGPALLLWPRLSRIVGLEAVLKRTLELLVVVPTLLVTLPLQAATAIWLLARGDRAVMTMTAVDRGGRRLSVPYFPISGWMRRNHLSRLPSLWLVLIGRLSLIGPRPIRIEEVHEYERHLPVLNALKPGFIGPWWLVRRGRPGSLAEEVQFDLQYARRYTFWMDLRVLERVAATLVLGREAAPAEAVRHADGSFGGTVTKL